MSSQVTMMFDPGRERHLERTSFLKCTSSSERAINGR